MQEVSLTVAEYLQAKTKYEAAKQQLEETQERLIKEMEADQRKTFRWVVGGVESKLTYVQQHQTFIDEPGLRKALKAAVFDRYTKRVLDRKAMEQAMDAGEVDPITVSRYVTTRPKKAFLTYTEKETE